MYLELLNSDLLTPEMRENLNYVDVREEFYEKTRFNEINSYEIVYACFEIAITQNIDAASKSLQQAIDHAALSHVQPATKASEEAVTHLSAAKK